MRSLFYFLLFLIFTSFFSCEKWGPEGIIDLGIDMIILNEQGENLLEISNDKKIVQDSIKIFYIENGIEKEFYESNLDFPRNFYIYDDDEYRKVFRVFLTNDLSLTGMRRVIVKWNSKDQDIIDGHVVRKEIANGRSEAFYCDTVWVNGILKFPNEEFTCRKFIFVK